jgi:hypothetical protein
MTATITLGRAVGIPAYTITSSDWRKHPGDILIQTDYDYPGIATSFGWSVHDALHTDGAIPTLRTDRSMPCDHGGTDGTVSCDDCGMSVAEFIASARDYLDDHIGATADDPGYFD